MWYSDSGNFWKFRAIFNRGSLDYVPDRGGFTEGQKDRSRTAFVKTTLGSRDFKEWCQRQTPASSEVFERSDGSLQFKATNNRSYGYTYLWAWETE